jgi:hypothetical protein
MLSGAPLVGARRSTPLCACNTDQRCRFGGPALVLWTLFVLLTLFSVSVLCGALRVRVLQSRFSHREILFLKRPFDGDDGMLRAFASVLRLGE